LGSRSDVSNSETHSPTLEEEEAQNISALQNLEYILHPYQQHPQHKVELQSGEEPRTETVRTEVQVYWKFSVSVR
jgi:hypothetical protein